MTCDSPAIHSANCGGVAAKLVVVNTLTVNKKEKKMDRNIRIAPMMLIL